MTAIVAYDQKFYDQLPTLFPAFDARSLFASNPSLSEQTAFRNSSLQGAYWGHASICKKLYVKVQNQEAVVSEVDAACDFGGLRRVANDNLRSG